MIDKIFPKIHPEGYKFLIIAVLITIVIYFISSFLGLVSYLQFGFIIFLEILKEFLLMMKIIWLVLQMD